MKFVWDHDLHIHSQLSLCSADPEQTTENILKYAVKNGLKVISIADHYWDEDVLGGGPCGGYDVQNFKRISSVRPLPQAEGVHFLFGCETDMMYDLTLGIAKHRIDEFDFIVIPTTHMHFRGFTMSDADLATSETRARAWVKRFEKVLDTDLPFYKVGIAHLTCGLIGQTREQMLDVISKVPKDDMYRLFKRSAEQGLNIEINLRWDDADDPEIALKPYIIAKDCKCKFYYGSDSHHPEEFMKREDFEARQTAFAKVVDYLDLEESDKINLEALCAK